MIRDFPLRRIGVVAVILDERNRVLLVRSHSYGRLHWELPGGWSEPNESVTDTAVREVKEETGLDIITERLCGIYYDPEFDMHYFTFICKLCDASQQPSPDLVEITECGYYYIDELPRPANDFTFLRIRDAVSDNTCNMLLPKIIGPRQWFE